MSVWPVNTNHGSSARVRSVTSKRNVLGRVPRRVQDLDRDVAELQHVAVANATEGEGRFRFGEQHIFGAGRFGQLTAGRDVIGVKMRIDDVANAHAASLRRRAR